MPGFTIACMFTEERHQRILDWLAEAGRATVADLALRLQVSDDTIRRDLRTLDEQGYLQKTHGGAVSLDVPRMARTQRADVLPQIKTQLAQAAVAHILPHQTLLLDAGQSVLAVAQALPDMPLTVITHALDVAVVLGDKTNIRLILAGGVWDARQRLFSGSDTLQQIAGYRADWAIMGACAVHERLGVTASEADDAAVKRAMLSGSANALLVADHSKINRIEPFFVADIANFKHWFTDRNPAWQNQPAGLQVLVPSHTQEKTA
ncbi:DeoR/GlpR family DNA-binding transcription regulator [Silvimonas sp.]|uniref:DeoR/GlpR family DNA-binding transcription regulator n=1 Tax=Silvimonas sp. TaxID=2650811 RepID=UPI00283AF995|nr:DeoR/GlpR family DNA-binding transcription regulator [Silvimonas sp.]MDR3428640.1 DeoR/GlpR family DNA-binding transcription regulator [Silvimonas sp.]